MACNNHHYQAPGLTIMSIKNLSFSYGRLPVLHELSLDIPSGRVFGLLGPNGSGKTTLFKCCLSFLKPSQGSITFSGQSLKSYTQRHLAQHIAYVPQEHLPSLPFTVAEMTAMGRNPHLSAIPRMGKDDRKAVEHALERVGIAHLKTKIYNTLSGGQRQLVLVARALAQEAMLMFLDEPTSSLDFGNQMKVWETISHIAQEGVGVVICCHDPNHILWFCQEAAVMHQCSILAKGKVDDIITAELLSKIYDRPIALNRLAGQTMIAPLKSHNQELAAHQ